MSTCSRNSWIPSIAKLPRLFPSNPNGRVTTATVKAPRLLAIRAITGAAPVPDPPPIPAVMKTMSAPVRASDKTSSLSSALRPTSGWPPAPRPRVNFGPSWITVSAFDELNA